MKEAILKIGTLMWAFALIVVILSLVYATVLAVHTRSTSSLNLPTILYKSLTILSTILPNVFPPFDFTDEDTATKHLEIVAAFAAGFGGLIPIILGTLIEIRTGQIRRSGPFQEHRLGTGRLASWRAERMMRRHYRGATMVIVFSSTFGWIHKRAMWKVVSRLFEAGRIRFIYHQTEFKQNELRDSLNNRKIDDQAISSLMKCFFPGSGNRLHLSYIERGRHTINIEKVILYRYRSGNVGKDVWRLVTIHGRPETMEFFSVIERFVLGETQNAEQLGETQNAEQRKSSAQQTP